MDGGKDDHGAAEDDEASRFCAAIARYRGLLPECDGTKDEAPPPPGYRLLSSEEVAGLEARGNAAVGQEGWAGVLVQVQAEQAAPTSCTPSLGSPFLDRIRGCSFFGRVLLPLGFEGGAEVEDGMGGPPHPTGLYDSTLADCVVETDSLVKGNGLLSRVVVGQEAVVVGNGLVACKSAEGTSFGSGMEIHVGSEAQGRPVVVHPGARMERDVFPQALAAAYPGFDRAAYLAGWEARGLLGLGARSQLAIIGRGARVVGCPRVVNAFVGEGAVLANAEVEEATLLSTLGERTAVREGAIVQRSILQWGAAVGGKAQVRDSLIMEHAHVEQEGKVNSSIACPDAGIATGECHHSLVGPFVGFHHQSLLIAALWPGGRGNVAYGAKVGSNHTGRAADQEAVLGEGVFFGLGVLVKLPINLLASPYTLVAAGTSLDQQRLHFPFSLVAPCRDPSIASLHFNQLRPAWVLQHSPYTVVRNQDKFAKRSRARRHRTTAPVLRRETVTLMLEARDRLKQALEAHPDVRLFTEATLPGLGANVTTRKSAEEAVSTYTRWVRRYALRGLVAHLLVKERSRGDARAEDEALAAELLRGEGDSNDDGSGDAGWWPYRRGLLQTEFASGDGVQDLFEELLATEQAVADAVEASKRRDDVRGEGIIDDYAAAREPLEGDKVIKRAREEATLVARAVDRLRRSPVVSLPLEALV